MRGTLALIPAIGLAYDYLGVLVFRLGFDGNISGGMGFRTPDERFQLDYSMENEPFALDYRFTLTYRFGAPVTRPAEKFREVIDDEYERAKAQAESLAQENSAAGQVFFKDQKYQQAEEPFRLAALLVPEDRKMSANYRRAQEAFRFQEIHRLSTDATLNPGPGQEAKAYLEIAELLSLGADNKEQLTRVLRQIEPRIPTDLHLQYSQQIVNTSTETARQLIAAGRFGEAKQVLEVLDVIASTQSAPVTAMMAQEIASKAGAVRTDFESLLTEQKDHADVRLARAALALLRAFPDDAVAAARAACRACAVSRRLTALPEGGVLREEALLPRRGVLRPAHGRGTWRRGAILERDSDARSVGRGRRRALECHGPRRSGAIMTQEMEDVMKMKKMAGVLMAAGIALMTTAPAFAQTTGNSAQVGTTLTTAAGWLVSTLGPGLFLIGMVLVGISLAMGNEDALRKGYYVVGGGALIFLSSSVVALLKSWTGN